MMKFTNSLFVLLCAVLCTTFVHAQPPDTITANPRAVALRQVWVGYGQHSNDRVGSGIGGIPDINGDLINEFAVYDGSAGFKIYYGSKEPLSTTPAMVLRVGGTHPIVGNFWGTGHAAVGGLRGDNAGGYTDLVYLYRTELNAIDTTKVTILDPRNMTPRTFIGIQDAIGADLDNDGADELIVATDGVTRENINLRKYEVWIYKGGPNFSLDTPTVILRDNEERQGITGLFVGRWDDDQYPDVALATDSSIGSGIRKLKFYFGTPGSPWNWTAPDRSIPLDNPFIAVLDCDGDSLLDIAAPPSAPFRVRLYRSGNGKSIRTRALTPDDADATYYRKDYVTVLNLGYLSDSTRHYEMLGIFGHQPLLGFGGGPSGPDHSSDVYSFAAIFNLVRPVKDVTGDGWNDLMSSFPTDNFNAGVAAIFAGGPYIPRDSLTTGVVDVAVAGRRDAISIWPNPTVADLHIAWRGDLHRMPARFSVHDLMGREVAIGRVEPWRGEALWHCADRPAGVYLVSVYDERGDLLVTTSIIKQ